MWPRARSDTSSKYLRCLCQLIYHNFTCTNSQNCPKIPLPYAGLCLHDPTLMMKDVFLSSITQHALLCHWCTGSLSCQYLTVYDVKCLSMKGVIYSTLLYYFNRHTDALPPDTLSLDRHQPHRLPMPFSPPNFGIVGRMLPALSTQGVILSNPTAAGGAEGRWNSYAQSEGTYTTGCGCQTAWTPSVPGSPPEPWHCLRSRVCCWWSGELQHGRIIAHIS